MCVQYHLQLIYNLSESISEPRFCFVDLPCGKTSCIFSTALTPAHRHRRESGASVTLVSASGSSRQRLSPVSAKTSNPVLVEGSVLWLETWNTPILGPPILPVFSGICEKRKTSNGQFIIGGFSRFIPNVWEDLSVVSDPRCSELSKVLGSRD